MKCPNCGTTTSGDICPACAIRPSPDNVIGYMPLPQSPIHLTAFLRTVKVRVSRRWGAYHRFTSGAGLEPGEHELHRTPVQEVRTVAVDRSVPVTGQGLAILTDRRLLIRDETNRTMELQLENIRVAHIGREDYPRTDPIWYVVVEWVTRGGNGPVREARLICPERSQSVDLAGRIAAMTASRRQVESCHVH